MDTQKPVISVPRRITNKFIVEHKDYSFVYGYDYELKGALGQCVVAHGEQNCWHLSTMRKMCKSSRYWEDCEYKLVVDIMFNELMNAKLFAGNNPIIFFPKIGDGCAQLAFRAPRIFNWMKEQIKNLQYPNIEWTY